VARQIRKEFTDLQKAEIFVRDRATCAFSGKSLWILDYGASPHWDVDWVDHIRPLAKGGKSEVENGICSSSVFNYKKSSNSRDNNYFFIKGKPTELFFYFFEKIPADVAHNLKRFKNLHYSDWFFNRGLYRFMCILRYLHNKKSGGDRTRDENYHGKSAFKILDQWRRIAEKEGVDSLENRNIIEQPSSDQEALLTLRGATSVDSIIALADSLYPTYEADCNAIIKLAEITEKLEGQAFLDGLKNKKLVSARVLSNIEWHVDIL